MVKVRDPFSWPGAVRRAIELVGAERLADELQNHGAKIRVQAVYDWSDPDSGSQPVLWQAEVMDRACAAKGERPFSRVWASRVGDIAANGDCPMGLTVEANETMAKLVREMNAALADSEISRCERDRLNEIVAAMYRSLGQVQANVTSLASVRAAQ